MSDDEGEVTTVVSATTTSKSLRATIPKGIVSHFNLSEGDQLRWSIKAADNKLVIFVEPIRSNSKKGR